MTKAQIIDELHKDRAFINAMIIEAIKGDEKTLLSHLEEADDHIRNAIVEIESGVKASRTI